MIKLRLFLKAKFKDFLSNKNITNTSVYGSEYSLCTSFEEIKSKGFSDIVAKLLNEEKAIQIDDNVYIDPYFDDYTENKWDIIKKKLIAKVKQDNFRALLNQSKIIVVDDDKGKNYVYQLSQQDIRRCNSVMIVAELVNRGYAYLKDEDIILYLNYLEKLEAKRIIQSDLSHFRTMLGECDNLKQLIALVEDCEFEDGYICTNFNKLQDVQLKTEIFSLIDIGIVKISDDGKKVLIKPQFASWLLACVEETSDRISFVNMYEE